jgi:hypothetical protein
MEASAASVIPQLHIGIFHRKRKAARRNSHYQVRLAIQSDGPPDNRRIGSELLLPKAVADNRHSLSRRLLFGPKTASRERSHTENVEQIPGDDLRRDIDRFARPAQPQAGFVIAHQIIERRVLLAKFEELRI